MNIFAFFSVFYDARHALRASAARRADVTLAAIGIDTDFSIFQVFAGGPSRNLRSRFTTVKFLARNFLFFAKFCEAKRREKFRQVRDLCATLRAKDAVTSRLAALPLLEIFSQSLARAKKF